MYELEANWFDLFFSVNNHTFYYKSSNIYSVHWFRKVINLKSTYLIFSNLRTVEHIRCVLVKDDGLPVDVSSGGQGQAGGKDDDGGPHAAHWDTMDLG